MSILMAIEMVLGLWVLCLAIDLIRAKKPRKFIIKNSINGWFHSITRISLFIMIMIMTLAVVYFNKIVSDTQIISSLSESNIWSMETWINFLNGCRVALTIIWIPFVISIFVYFPKAHRMNIWKYSEDEQKIVDISEKRINDSLGKIPFIGKYLVDKK